MEKILDNIDKSMNIIISLFTIYNLIRGFWLNKNKKQLEKQREDLQKKLHQQNISNNNNISNSFNTTIHNETNIKNEIIDINQDLKNTLKSRNTSRNIAYIFTIFLFVLSFILYVIHYFKEQFKGCTIADFINSFIPSFEKLTDILTISYKSAIIVLLIINLIIAVLVILISMLKLKLKWRVAVSSLLYGILNYYVLISASSIDSKDIHYSIQEPKLSFIISFLYLMVGFITAFFSNYILYSYLFNSEFEDELFNQTIKRFFIWLALTVLFAFLSFINYHNGLQITLNFIKNLLNLI